MNENSTIRDKDFFARILANKCFKIKTGIIAPTTLPYKIKDNKFHSYTIVVSGTGGTINGISVPQGTYSYGGGVADKLTGVELGGTASFIITTQETLK